MYMELVQMLVLDIIVSVNETLTLEGVSSPSGILVMWYGVVGFSYILTMGRILAMWRQCRRKQVIVMIGAWWLTLLFGMSVVDLEFDSGLTASLPAVSLAAIAGVWCGCRAGGWFDRLWWRFMLAFSIAISPLFQGSSPVQICLTIIAGYLLGLLIRWGATHELKDNLTEEQKFTGAAPELS